MSLNSNATETTVPGGPGGPLFIPISLKPSVTTFVTQATPVTFTLEVPPGLQEPPLVISYFAVQNQPGPSAAADTASVTTGGPKPVPIYQDLPLQVLNIPNPPTPVWSNGVASFTLQVDASVFNLLSSPQALLTVVARINDPDVNSSGICAVPINLPTSG